MFKHSRVPHFSTHLRNNKDIVKFGDAFIQVLLPYLHRLPEIRKLDLSGLPTCPRDHIDMLDADMLDGFKVIRGWTALQCRLVPKQTSL